MYSVVKKFLPYLREFAELVEWSSRATTKKNMGRGTLPRGETHINSQPRNTCYMVVVVIVVVVVVVIVVVVVDVHVHVVGFRLSSRNQRLNYLSVSQRSPGGRLSHKIQDLAHLLRQHCPGKWLLQKNRPLPKDSVSHNCIIGVP